MSFIRSIFSSKLTSAATTALIENLKSALRATCAEIADNERTLASLATLTDEQHASAEAGLAASTRLRARLEAQIIEAEAAHVAALKAEASQDLFARRDAATKRVAVDYLRAEAQLRKASQEAASAAAAMVAIDEEVARINSEIKAARKADRDGVFPDLISTSDDRYRSEPDAVTPASTYEVETVCIDGSYGPTPAGYAVRSEGKRILNAGEFLHKITKTFPERRNPGARLISPTSELILPALRLGEKRFWPPEGR